MQSWYISTCNHQLKIDYRLGYINSMRKVRSYKKGKTISSARWATKWTRLKPCSSKAGTAKIIYTSFGSKCQTTPELLFTSSYLSAIISETRFVTSRPLININKLLKIKMNEQAYYPRFQEYASGARIY